MKPNGRKSLTQQHLRDSNNIRHIMEKSTRMGQRVHLPTEGMFYGDFTNIGSYHDSMNRMIQAQEAFMTLPSRVRSKFENDPGKLIQFLENPKNVQEAVELGILDKKALPPEEETIIETQPKSKTKTKPETKESES